MLALSVLTYISLTCLMAAGQSKMVLPRSDCFKTKVITWPAVWGPAPTESPLCEDGNPLCRGQVHGASTRKPFSTFRDTVYFVADDTNRCKFWRCITHVWAVQMDCAPGSRLEANYVGGSANPCSDRYYIPPVVACSRPVAVTTTTEGPTISGGFPFPTEVIPNVTRSLPTGNEVVTLSEIVTVSERAAVSKAPIPQDPSTI